MTLLELREYPRADKAVISVTTAYPGADAELVQGFITNPLQRAISEAAGIDYHDIKLKSGRFHHFRQHGFEY